MRSRPGVSIPTAYWPALRTALPSLPRPSYPEFIKAEPGIRLYYRLDDPTGSSSATDASSFGRHGKYNLGTAVQGPPLLDAPDAPPSAQFDARAIPWGTDGISDTPARYITELTSFVFSSNQGFTFLATLGPRPPLEPGPRDGDYSPTFGTVMGVGPLTPFMQLALINSGDTNPTAIAVTHDNLVTRTNAVMSCALGTVRHIAATWTGSTAAGDTLRVMFQGSMLQTLSTLGSPFQSTPASGTLHVGARPTNDQGITAALADVALIRPALSDDVMGLAYAAFRQDRGREPLGVGGVPAITYLGRPTRYVLPAAACPTGVDDFTVLLRATASMQALAAGYTMRLAGTGVPGGVGWQIDVRSNELRLSLLNATGQIDYTGSFNVLGGPFNLAFAYNVSSRLASMVTSGGYVVTSTANSTTSWSTAAPLYLGQQGPAATNPFSGTIHQVYVLDRALSYAEMRAVLGAMG